MSLLSKIRIAVSVSCAAINIVLGLKFYRDGMNDQAVTAAFFALVCFLAIYLSVKDG